MMNMDVPDGRAGAIVAGKIMLAASACEQAMSALVAAWQLKRGLRQAKLPARKTAEPERHTATLSTFRILQRIGLGNT